MTRVACRVGCVASGCGMRVACRVGCVASGCGMRVACSHACWRVTNACERVKRDAECI